MMDIKLYETVSLGSMRQHMRLVFSFDRVDIFPAEPRAELRHNIT